MRLNPNLQHRSLLISRGMKNKCNATSLQPDFVSLPPPQVLIRRQHKLNAQCWRNCLWLGAVLTSHLETLLCTRVTFYIQYITILVQYFGWPIEAYNTDTSFHFLFLFLPFHSSFTLQTVLRLS